MGSHIRMKTGKKEGGNHHGARWLWNSAIQ